MQSSDQMVPFSGAFVAILVTSVVLILPAEVQTAVNKESEEEGQKMEVGLPSIQQNFASIAGSRPSQKGRCLLTRCALLASTPQSKRQVGSILFPPASTD